MRRPGAVLLAALVLVALFLLLRRDPETPPPPLPPAPASSSRPAPLRPAPAVDPSPADPVSAPEPKAAPIPGGTAGTGDYRIHGRVVATGGAGVAGARVEVRAWSGKEPDVRWHVVVASSGPGGEFSVAMDRARASAGFGIETAAEGFLEGWIAVQPADYDEGRGVDVPVEPARSIAGRVVDEYARPIPQSVVQLWYGSETTWPTTVDAEGRFRTPAKAPRRAFELIVEAPGHPRREVPVAAAPAEESTDVGDLVFRRGGRVAGVAVDREGRPVAGVPLCLTGIAGTSSPRTRADEAGRFEFTDVGEGEVGVYADGPGTAPDAAGNPRSWRGGLGKVAVGRTDLKVVLSAETTVILRFVDAATGSPILVTRSEFALWRSGTPEPAGPTSTTSSTSPYGSDRVSFVSEGRYDALVRSPGFEDARVNGFDVPDVAEVTVDIPLRRSR